MMITIITTHLQFAHGDHDYDVGDDHDYQPTCSSHMVITGSTRTQDAAAGLSSLTHPEDLSTIGRNHYHHHPHHHHQKDSVLFLSTTSL